MVECRNHTGSGEGLGAVTDRRHGLPLCKEVPDEVEHDIIKLEIFRSRPPAMTRAF